MKNPPTAQIRLTLDFCKYLLPLQRERNNGSREFVHLNLDKQCEKGRGPDDKTSHASRQTKNSRASVVRVQRRLPADETSSNRVRLNTVSRRHRSRRVTKYSDGLFNDGRKLFRMHSKRRLLTSQLDRVIELRTTASSTSSIRRINRNNLHGIACGRRRVPRSGRASDLSSLQIARAPPHLASRVSRPYKFVWKEAICGRFIATASLHSTNGGIDFFRLPCSGSLTSGRRR